MTLGAGDLEAIRFGRRGVGGWGARGAHIDAVLTRMIYDHPVGARAANIDAVNAGRGYTQAMPRAVAQHERRIVRRAEYTLDFQRVVRACTGLAQVGVVVVADEGAVLVPVAGRKLDIGDGDMPVLVGVARGIVRGAGHAGAG